jgi:hypothetical protein
MLTDLSLDHAPKEPLGRLPLHYPEEYDATWRERLGDKPTICQLITYDK